MSATKSTIPATIRPVPTLVDPPVPMNRVLRTIRDFILWSYERGSIQYDIMVTIILAFVFLSPRLINFKDKPVGRSPHRTEVLVMPGAAGGWIYQIDAAEIKDAGDDDSVRAQLSSIIEPIAGNVTIDRYEKVPGGNGYAAKYNVFVRR